MKNLVPFWAQLAAGRHHSILIEMATEEEQATGGKRMGSIAVWGWTLTRRRKILEK